jgi:polysaccharide export outer membrane protein
MFRVPEGKALQNQVAQVESNYTIQKNDFLTIEVFTNQGERIIDPDFRLQKDLPTQSSTTREPVKYLVDMEGKAKFPMVGEIKVEGLTLRQAEQVLQQAYAEFYQQPYVVVRYLNKRVIVLGAPGGQVIPLNNDNIRLVEILATAKGLNNDAKANNIRVIRGEQVYVVDFSTIEGYQKNNLIMLPGDVVYVEPIRRPVVEGLRDYAPIASVVATLTTLIVVLISL